MASIFDKIRTITLGNLHSLLDAIIDLNSISAIKQYVRDLEKGRDMLADNLAIVTARIGTMPADIGSLQARIDSLNEDIEIILGDDDEDNDHLAESLIKARQGLERQVQVKSGALSGDQTEQSSLKDAVSKLNSRIEEMTGRIQVLEDLERSTKGKERAAKSLASISIGEAPSVDNVEQRLRERAAVADGRLNRQLGGLTEGLGTSSGDASAAAELIRMKQRIAEKKRAAT